MTPAEIRFAADGMVQSLGTWLRLLGYDCLSGAGRWLVERAAAEQRVFLTRNTHLAANLPQALLARSQIVLVHGDRLPAQLREVVGRFALDTGTFAFSRCLRCNVPLVAELPAFWRCAVCGQRFWRGSHVTNSLARLRGWLATPAPASSCGDAPGPAVCS